MTARVLVIAGSDSGGGAGIQADIRTITMLGGHAMTAVTAITAQNTLGVQRVMPVPAGMVLAQIHSVAADIGIDAVKIGMLGSAETARAVAGWLAGYDGPVVLDPVMVASSGEPLADEATLTALRAVRARASVVTPNLPEVAALGGLEALLADGDTVLVKGGHAEGREVVDRLFLPHGGEVARWADARLPGRHTHGTGCTLSSGIATGLAQGMALTDAIERGIRFVRAAIAAAPGLGGGHGPMGHHAVRLGDGAADRSAPDDGRGLG